MTQENKPRTLLVKTRTYNPVPDRFMLPDDNKELFKSFGRFPMKNPHWQTEVVEYNDEEFILESINETAFDTQERPIHEFYEDEDGIHESSIVYFEGKDGKTMSVRATSEGYVYVGENSGNLEDIDPRNMIFITNGRRNDLCMPYDEVDEDTKSFGRGQFIESDMEQLTEDLWEEDYKYKYDVVEKDQYGNPLKALTWLDDDIIHFRTYEYIYAK